MKSPWKTLLKIGNTAPDFELPDQNDKTHKLSDYKGKYLLIYFYPKDDTPGCTKEACGFRDNLPHFEKSNLEVVGISADSVKSHEKFAAKHKLPFTILADENKTTVNDYGVWQQKSFLGRKYMGINRWSFLIGPDRKIIKIYEKVNPLNHSKEVLKDLKKLQN